MQMKLPVLAVLAVLAVGNRVSSKLDINQKVFIDNVAVLGAGAGESALGECGQIPRTLVDGEGAPSVKVCGTSIKATFYLMNRCEPYHEHSKTLGMCDKTMPSTTCDAWSPTDDARFDHYQSYRIDSCP